MGRVIVVGSLNVDLVTSVETHPQPGETVLGDGLDRYAGGKGANQALAAARAGAEVVMVGRVGDDEGGSLYRARLEAADIDVTHLVTDPQAPTGHALIVVNEGGENTIVVVPGANGRVGRASRDLDVLADCAPEDVLLMQLEVPLATVAAAAQRAHERGLRVIINVAPFAALPPDIVALADPLIANEHEARALADAGGAPSSLLVTFGAHGASWDGEEFAAHTLPTHRVQDTTGAGDAFCGALAAALAAGAGRREAMDAALAAGAAAVQHRGAQPDPHLSPT
ncbi:MAG: PfkB family carbohydrate kinase [Actinomycetia bacterium]|nr:PfkB family carbohydrate kinase [Actinomycetes bacterium]